jgi:hypothetical protein
MRVLSALLLIAVAAAYAWVALRLTAGRIDWPLALAAVPALVALTRLAGWGWTRIVGIGVALLALAIGIASSVVAGEDETLRLAALALLVASVLALVALTAVGRVERRREF